jgi:hypothetical protein
MTITISVDPVSEVATEARYLPNSNLETYGGNGDSKNFWDGMLVKSPIKETLIQWPSEKSSQDQGDTSDFPQEFRDQIDPFVRPDFPVQTLRNVQVLQQWEGVVCDILNENTFTVELFDLTDRTNQMEVAEMSVRDVPSADRALIQPGATFYWTIGTQFGKGGEEMTISEIRLRRFPVWSKRMLDAIQVEAEGLFEQIHSHDESSTSR